MLFIDVICLIQLNSELSFSAAQVQRLQLELASKDNELTQYRVEWEKRKAGKKSLIEEELRERLRLQGREMAEQLDKMEARRTIYYLFIYLLID